MLKPYQFHLWHGLRHRDVFQRPDAIACMVADTLAYATSRNIAFTDALRNVPFYRPADFRSHLFAFLNCWPFSLFAVHPACWAKDYPLSLRVEALIHDLEQGEPLSYVLEEHLREFFPPEFILGLEHAENRNRVEVALPALAEALNYPRMVRDERVTALRLALLRFVVIFPTVFFLGVFILPKFARMMDEYGVREWHLSFSVLHAGLTLTHWVFAMAIILFLLTRASVIREWVGFRIPFLRRDCERMRMADLTRSLLTFLRSGEDVMSAAEWAHRSTRSPWLSKRLKILIGALREGAALPQAWAQMGVNMPLAEWLLHNAALREDPVSALELLLDKLYADISQSTRRWEVLVDPICVLLLGTFVGALSYSLVHSLVALIHVAM